MHQALGRSRGGLTTKVHLAVDGRGLPLSIVLTPGNANDRHRVRRRPRRDPHPARQHGPPAHDTGPCAG
ncbi:transposase [Actinomadura verrucosospora]|uniref:transposase n=1 Tax=Actinomadura verrucosospora TaxID=46165 RepID=UPI003D188B9E